MSTLFESAADRDAVAHAVAAAAPSTVSDRGDAAMLSSLDDTLHAPMFALLSTLADNKYVLGRRYAEWCTGAPLLESAVAAAAMAQDELGHARSFYPLVRGFPQGHGLQPMEERGWQDRPTSAIACLDRSFESWTVFVAANLVVDTALTVLLEAAVDSPYEPLRQRARKIVQEEVTHWQHALGWLHRIGVGPLAPAIARFGAHALTWYGHDLGSFSHSIVHDGERSSATSAADPVIGPLHAAGVLSAGSDALRTRLLDRLGPRLQGDLDLRSVNLPWRRWNAQTRRLLP